MSVQALGWALSQKTGDHTAKAVLICLANYADHNNQCWPGVALLAEQAEISVRTAQRQLGALEDLGFIRREQRRREDGSLTTMLYTLLMSPAGDADVTTPSHDDTTLVTMVSPATEPSLEPKKKEDTSLRSVSKKATRIPTDFAPDLDEAERLGLSRRAAEEEAASFGDYWRAKPVNATKLDWPATWRNWVRKAVRDTQTRGGRNGQFRFDQGTVIKPAVVAESPTRAALRIARGGG